MRETTQHQWNSAYRPVTEWKGRYVNLYGGGGSGKSHFTAQHLVRILSSVPGVRCLVVRKVGRTLRQSCFALICEVIHSITGLKVAINKTDMSIVFPNGSQFIFSGIDDVEKLKSIHRIHLIWAEEMTEMTELEYLQLDIRLRGDSPVPKQFFGSYNPVDVNHWIKREHHDKPNPKRLILKTTFRDNAFIDDDYRETLLSISDENYRAIYADGEWGDIKGIIYTHYRVGSIPARANISDSYFGLDFGYNAPSALVWVREVDGEKYISNPIYQSQLTTPELIILLKQYCARRPVYCDSAEPDRIEELRRAGIRAYPAKKDVALGIDHVLRSKIVIDPNDTYIYDEIRAYRWREDKQGDLADREPVKIKDHAMDAMRYAIYTHKKRGTFFE